MDQTYVVRHKVLVEGIPARRVARELGISRNTVRRYVAGAEPGQRRPTPPRSPVAERVRSRLEELLAESPRWTGGKQRLTATRLHELLRAEGLAAGVTVVKELVAEWKRQRAEVFVPLVYRPGDLGEVDFFEVLVDVADRRQKAWMFVLRLMHSGRDFACLYERQDQVSFLDAHVRAFAHLDAVPRRLLYDNLKPAVARVLVGAERKLTARFLALATHYLFEPCFARPATGHDKGGVESRGRAIRWQHLVPIPSGPSLEAISATLQAGLDTRAATQRDREGRTVAERFAAEHGAMLPLAAAAFQAAATHLLHATRRALVQVQGGQYSVPDRWAGLEVTAHVGAFEVELVCRDERVRHRRVGFGQRSLDYRHYLPTLSRKPQAVRQVADELVAQLGEPFGAVWRRLLQEHEAKEAARHLARVLGAIVEQGQGAVAARLERSLRQGAPLQLALRLPAPPPAALGCDGLPYALRDVEVASASAADYDALLPGVP